MKRVFSIALASLFLLGTARASPPFQERNGLLVDSAGMTVYKFDNDIPNRGKSACHGRCAEAWPPVEANNDSTPTENFSIIMRRDGIQQWLYRGTPLYHSKMDSKPGDANGDNHQGLWHAVAP